MVARPQGDLALSDFDGVTNDVSSPGPGMAVVRNSYISVDPHMRGHSLGTSLTPPFEVGKAMTGAAVDRVIEISKPGRGAGRHRDPQPGLARVRARSRKSAPRRQYGQHR